MNTESRCRVDTLIIGDWGDCQKPADWVIDLHGCAQVKVCGSHAQEWKRVQDAAVAGHLVLDCAHCRKHFTRTADAYSIGPIPKPPRALRVVKPIHPLSYRLPDAWEAAINGWESWMAAAGSSAATRRTRKAHVRGVARQLGVNGPQSVTRTDLEGLLGCPTHSKEYRRGLRASLTSFYRWCTDAGMVKSDPAAALPTVKSDSGAPKPATDEIWSQILDTADKRTLLMARLAGEAGLRRAEIAQVHTDDLLDSPDGAQLIVHGKGAKQRVVPLNASLAAAVGAACPHGGFVFPGKIDGHLSPGFVGKLLSRVMPDGWSGHKLRHRFATRGYAGTRDILAVQIALGHSSVQTTQRYTLVTPREVRAVSDAASNP
ncbi:tyrosine-type recombinase/integrase [Mycobacterium kansasii]|uniref:tyrosine-type recombinase/integrase n=1 Tax=Mycobacterium kansasii TaxID=1768 RepID=UPI000F2D9161|nr:tyrosine-type recombinase/integrase [Mycobacterium kansasii]VAZ65323.1 Tyrosine recombinase XerC [Mycobacterium kansasii]